MSTRLIVNFHVLEKSSNWQELASMLLPNTLGMKWSWFAVNLESNETKLDIAESSLSEMSVRETTY